MGVLANVTGDTEDAVTVAQAVQTWFPTSLAALSFLIFNLLDSPCLAAIATMAQQMQSKSGSGSQSCSRISSLTSFACVSTRSVPS